MRFVWVPRDDFRTKVESEWIPSKSYVTKMVSSVQQQHAAGLTQEMRIGSYLMQRKASRKAIDLPLDL